MNADTTRAKREHQHWKSGAGMNIRLAAQQTQPPRAIHVAPGWDGNPNRYDQLTDSQIDRILADEAPTPIPVPARQQTRKWRASYQ